MRYIIVRFAVALLRLVNVDAHYQVSRRINDKQKRGYGRVHFADESLTRSLHKARAMRCGDTETIYVRLDATIARKEGNHA